MSFVMRICIGSLISIGFKPQKLRLAMLFGFDDGSMLVNGIYSN